MTSSDRLTWELGWDFALFTWPIPSDADKAFCDGYRAFNHGGNRPTKKHQSIYDKKWLQLRMNAWRRGKRFDADVTPQFLASLMPFDKCCPVTQLPFTFATQEDTDWSVERANNEAHYERRNLIVISVRANAAKSNLSFERICEFADGSLENTRLSQREWQRLAELVAPMHEEPGRRAVMYLEGQKVADGVAMTPVAELQHVLARCAIEEARGGSRYGYALLFHTMMKAICRSKLEARAFRQLVIAVRQRARHVQYPDRLWATPRVHKKLDAFGMAIGHGDGECAQTRIKAGLDEAGTILERLGFTDGNGVHAQRVTRGAPGIQGVSR